jgi:hypothetical protein
MAKLQSVRVQQACANVHAKAINLMQIDKTTKMTVSQTHKEINTIGAENFVDNIL